MTTGCAGRHRRALDYPNWEAHGLTAVSTTSTTLTIMPKFRVMHPWARSRASARNERNQDRQRTTSTPASRRRYATAYWGVCRHSRPAFGMCPRPALLGGGSSDSPGRKEFQREPIVHAQSSVRAHARAGHRRSSHWQVTSHHPPRVPRGSCPVPASRLFVGRTCRV